MTWRHVEKLKKAGCKSCSTEQSVQHCFGIREKKCGRQSCTRLPWIQTSNSGWGKQCVINTKQEEKQHLPSLSGHTGRVPGKFLHCGQHLLTQLEVHRAEVLRPVMHTSTDKHLLLQITYSCFGSKLPTAWYRLQLL